MNEFFVGLQGDKVIILKPVPQVLTKEQAIDLAVSLVVIADMEGTEFQKQYEERINA